MSAKMIVLILTILMPKDVPDIRHVMRMESLDSCWDGAKDFLAHDMSEDLRQKGALGLGAMCAYQEAASDTP